MKKYGIIIQIIGLLIMGASLYGIIKFGNEYLMLVFVGLFIVMAGLFMILYDHKKQKK